ncbi:tetratricopeptide repeat protein [Sphingobium boeckii]|uniref:Cytochrome c-type biogenesis protein CcmH/NrfG n=1 Tax=Sphingobium boeckii TaxID=1082345 RepID=A0A7W9AKX3_9SPHN|nr:tetratricopeptide repeat protein [Sphingobium boeckii]MBB5687418.1 cytochrome c-type biogenesis protein CcmH/NrfG [Sphingobium boeckii]
MGWLIIVAMALVAAGALWKIGRLPRESYELVGAALLLGLSGYAWQGHPAQAGSPIAQKSKNAEVDPALVEQRKNMTGRFSGEAQWLDTADAYARYGSTRDAVNVMRGAVKEYPNNATLWTGLGSALLNHGNGIMSPAAQFAFERALKLQPQHPGPPFYLGLSLLQAGQPDKALQVWTDQLAATPRDAPWHADLEQRVSRLRTEMGLPPLPVTGPATPEPALRP